MVVRWQLQDNATYVIIYQSDHQNVAVPRRLMHAATHWMRGSRRQLCPQDDLLGRMAA
jgi:hypothetical protein